MENTYSQKTNITDARQSCKSFGIIDKSECFSYNSLITSLAKEVMFLVALVSLSVCLFVCLSVDNITQKVMNGLG